MASSPPGSPAGSGVQRPMSAMITSNRSSSRMSQNSRHGRGGSRASDEDGKTAVKVAVRVRPPLKSSDPGYDLVPQRFRGSTCQVTTSTNLAIESTQGKKLFVFDRVFGEDVDQEGVWEYLSDSVNSFVQGYNVSILAYGQSGAGKSYTMGTTGPQEQGDAQIMGIVPRAAASLFEKLTGSSNSSLSGSGLRKPSRYSMHGASQLQSPSKPANRNWQLKATYVEIYQEQLRDLLVDESIPLADRAQVSIREDPKGRILLTGLRQVTINSVEDLLGALNFGSAIRQTDATAVNARSSRSHAVFSLNLVQKRAGVTSAKEKRYSMPVDALSGTEGWVTVDSKLHFVDLAGSERLKNTGAQGERAKEGISINAGLASLGKVISQLSSRAPGSHVSYRDSRLTRLLQDSLGGNAITYMVACVNPAEFHLSETLNTVQYAQRARAIQSKPQIQQINDDSDKQAAIDRLRAEVSFLRDQIRLSEKTTRGPAAPQERSERQGEREIELHNQLLDIQENYNALSQRHAKLISEIAKARETRDGEDMELNDSGENSALDRINRSNSFAEAVEQVVLEYEKTIQSLEASLSTTRSTLSTSESNLLEKETKIAYMETLTQQLQSRIQKAMDREANDQNYLHELESRVAGATTGEEKSNAVVQSLRQELTRARENESSCEEYISTLEERLAEAEQDHDMMQREIERLEHVIERQRGISKLDNLLYELDHIRGQKEPSERAESRVNGHSKTASDSFHSFAGSDHTVGADEEETKKSPETSETGLLPATPEEDEPNTPRPAKDVPRKLEATDRPPINPDEMPHSPAQSKFVADKLESVTQELFDLRMEHETTVTDFEELNRKYQLALNTLAEMQDAVDDVRKTRAVTDSAASSRPTSFLANGIEEDGQPSSSRTLSSELSLLGESSNTMDSSDVETTHKRSVSSASTLPRDDQLVQEMETLKRLHAEKEENMAELTENYTQLQTTHQDTLDYVEELKTEIQRAQLARPSSPNTQMGVLRRKSSQNVGANDRANRSFNSLQNIAQDHFEEDPDTLQNFELNLTAVRTELQMRTDRVADLEAEMNAVRKEMEAKMTIISGLTRERSSLKSSPMDISVVAQMRDQLLETENQIRLLHETHATREAELTKQIDSLKNALATKAAGSERSGEAGQLWHATGNDENSQISQLQQEVTQWKSKHDTTLAEMQVSEQKLISTISGLEASLRGLEAAHGEGKATTEREISHDELLTAQLEEQNKKHREVVSTMEKEVDEHKATAAANAARLAELEQSHANILHQIEEDGKSKDLTEKELKTHRDLVANLENQLEQHKSAISLHQQGLTSLQESHARDIEELNDAQSDRLEKQIREHKEVVVILEEKLAQAQADHQESTAALQAELSKAQNELKELMANVSAALEKDVDASSLHSHVQALVNERQELIAKQQIASKDLDSLRQGLETAKAHSLDLESKVEELKMINDETVQELVAVSEREKKSSRLVEELEDQLSSNYDQHQAANNRLSALQSERQVAYEEAISVRGDLEREIEESRARISLLEAQLDGSKRNSNRESLDPRDAGLQRSNSATSNLRKSASHTSLPSPPPAIPLPPLPGAPAAANAPSPPTSRHQSKDLAQAQLVEDQEARIRTIEKHLFAEKQLTATLEEALTDLESSSTKLKTDLEGWRRKCTTLEDEVSQLKKQSNLSRYSLQQVEEERNARMKLEADRANLEARMAQLSAANKKKKKSTLNCF